MKPTIKECGGYPVVRDSMPTVLNDALTNVSGLGAIHDGFLQKRKDMKRRQSTQKILNSVIIEK